jgi:DNA-3-methyladenine glycosylase I
VKDNHKNNKSHTDPDYLSNKKRCRWVNAENKLHIKYHDEEWGVPTHNDKILFEMLILEGAQAGLSWETILNKRENYQKAFDNFDCEKIAKYNDAKQNELLQNQGIVRNKLKIKSAIKNAKVFLKIQKEFGSFDKYIWNFVNNKPIQNKFKSFSDLPANTELSDKISTDLKKQGMNFIGPTIVYAYMQSIGMVNDHEISCFINN